MRTKCDKCGRVVSDDHAQVAVTHTSFEVPMEVFLCDRCAATDSPQYRLGELEFILTASGESISLDRIKAWAEASGKYPGVLMQELLASGELAEYPLEV